MGCRIAGWVLAVSVAGTISACAGSPGAETHASTAHAATAHPPDRDGISEGPSSETSSGSPSAILAAATAAINHVRTVHVSGSRMTGRFRALDLDLVSRAGAGGEVRQAGARGEVRQAGSRFEIVRIDRRMYVRASAGTSGDSTGAPAPRTPTAPWLQVSLPDPGLASLGQLTDVQTMFTSLLTRQVSVHDRLIKEAFRTAGGGSVAAVHDERTGGTLYVSTDGPPYPVKLTQGGRQGGLIVFTRFNEPVRLTAPANALERSALR